MSSTLNREIFTRAYLDSVEIKNFNCGDEPWELEVSDWLKRPFGEDGAITSIENTARPGRVWLYRSQHDERLVGYAGLGYTSWRWTGNKDPYLPLTVITWIGLDKTFWGLPKGENEERFSHQIMKNLITEALADADTHPVLGLVVHSKNERAIKLYLNFKFVENVSPFKDRDTGVIYNRMTRPLVESEVLDRMIEEAKKRKS